MCVYAQIGVGSRAGLDYRGKCLKSVQRWPLAWRRGFPQVMDILPHPRRHGLCWTHLSPAPGRGPRQAGMHRVKAPRGLTAWLGLASPASGCAPAAIAVCQVCCDVQSPENLGTEALGKILGQSSAGLPCTWDLHKAPCFLCRWRRLAERG